MSNVCPDCGLPKDLCVCQTIAQEKQKIEVTMVKKKFGKSYTIIKGIGKGVDISDLARKLKAKFACGGTVREDQIELQGDHRQRSKPVLVDLGFPEEMIEVS